jgi:hypothetical protein
LSLIYPTPLLQKYNYIIIMFTYHKIHWFNFSETLLRLSFSLIWRVFSNPVILSPLILSPWNLSSTLPQSLPSTHSYIGTPFLIVVSFIFLIYDFKFNRWYLFKIIWRKLNFIWICIYVNKIMVANAYWELLRHQTLLHALYIPLPF